jgi:hypothetical protein
MARNASAGMMATLTGFTGVAGEVVPEGAVSPRVHPAGPGRHPHDAQALGCRT